MTEVTYLFAHTNKDGSGIAQKRIVAVSETEAREKFGLEVGDERVIVKVGIEGVEDYG